MRIFMVYAAHPTAFLSRTLLDSVVAFIDSGGGNNSYIDSTKYCRWSIFVWSYFVLLKDDILCESD